MLIGGRKRVIFQLQDDHSRLAIATHVASAETSEAVLALVKKGIETHGVPLRLFTDNDAAITPSRRCIEGQLVAYVTSLGVKAITGKPCKPTRQGKNERFHQTLFRWLDKQPIPTLSSKPRLMSLTRYTIQSVRTRDCPGAPPAQLPNSVCW